MTEFFTWQGLLTFSDAALATAMITQLLKDMRWIEKLPTRALSVIVAFFVLVGATLVNEGFDIKKLSLALINAVVVALASNGAFDAVNERIRD